MRRLSYRTLRQTSSFTENTHNKKKAGQTQLREKRNWFKLNMRVETFVISLGRKTTKSSLSRSFLSSFVLKNPFMTFHGSHEFQESKTRRVSKTKAVCSQNHWQSFPSQRESLVSSLDILDIPLKKNKRIVRERGTQVSKAYKCLKRKREVRRNKRDERQRQDPNRDMNWEADEA